MCQIFRSRFDNRCDMDSSCVTYSDQGLTIGMTWTPFVSISRSSFDNRCAMDAYSVTYSCQGLTIGVLWSRLVSHIQVKV